MIGVSDVRRTSRMIARPSISGSIRSRTTSAGSCVATAARARRTVRRLDHPVALALEVGPDEADDLGVVIDDEDRSVGARGHHRDGSRTRMAAPMTIR